MPLTKTKAEKKKFKQIGEKNKCSGDFQGYRYMKENDSKNAPALILLYDVNGYIAGIQTSFAEKHMKDPNVKAWFKKQRMFHEESLPVNKTDTYYTLTAYLVDPKIICSVGRTKEEFKHEAAGTNLYLKNGTHNILIPKHESDLANTNWTLGACFPSMGTHYWYSTSKDMNCKEFQPFFLLYNRKKLTVFGFVAFGGWKFSSYRYEHPPELSYRGKDEESWSHTTLIVDIGYSPVKA
uniref:Uncharacterized protein n=1 Tax=Strigamia maritima TaxID=126957 RepID=T1IYE1_STRMM